MIHRNIYVNSSQLPPLSCYAEQASLVLTV